MSLAIDTFSNAAGIGSAFFKAVGHPLCRPAAEAILARLQSAKRPAAYDPQNTLAPFIAVNGSDSVPKFAAVYAQNIAQIGKTIANHPARPITALTADNPDILLLPVFDAKILLAHIAHLIPDGCEVITLDEMRLPEKFLADRRRYLNPLNFATNLLFFRERPGAHTRLTTANYWSAYGATSPFVWGRLFGENGDILADFEKPLGGANHRFSLDSQELKREFNLPDFCGQVFFAHCPRRRTPTLSNMSPIPTAMNPNYPAPTMQIHGLPTSTPEFPPRRGRFRRFVGAKLPSRRNSRRCHWREYYGR